LFAHLSGPIAGFVWATLPEPVKPAQSKKRHTRDKIRHVQGRTATAQGRDWRNSPGTLD